MRIALMWVSCAFLTFALIGCTSSPSEKEKIYDIKGKVLSVDADKKNVRLDHEDIPGFMKAMEMDFTVSDAKILSGLAKGDAVQGKLKVKDTNYVITELHKR